MLDASVSSIKRLGDTVYKLRCMFVCTDVYFFQKLLVAVSSGKQTDRLGRERPLLYDLFLPSGPSFFTQMGRRAWQ